MERLNKKIVLVINGKGGSGKDTVCGIVGERFKTRNISSVDPIKAMAKTAGWQGEKTDKARKMLSDLKRLMVEYNDLPTRYALEQMQSFLACDEEVMFVHIREAEEIAKLVKAAPVKVYTLLIRRMDEKFTARSYGNVSDDDVENYAYDFCYVNDKPLSQLKADFNRYFDEEIVPSV